MVSSAPSIKAKLKSLEPLAPYSTFHIGGPAKYFIEVTSIEEMQAVRAFINVEQMPYFILGKGSNLLFDDKGFNGLVVLNKIDFFEANGNDIHVGAGYSFARLGAKMSRRGLSGLEFASGIPGSVGGALYMNAGANGQQTSDCLQYVTYISNSAEIIEKSAGELAFSYRTSLFQSMDAIIVGAKFTLEPSPEARKKQQEFVAYRTSTQPYGEPSAGCIFRNLSEKSVGALIEEAGLKGFSVGGAMVSTQHANFIVNRGDATAQDVLQLITHIRKTLSTYDLQLEVTYVSG